MKNGNLYQQVKSAKKDHRVAWAKKNEMVLAMEKELEEAKRVIIEKYEPILKALQKETSEKYIKLLDIAVIYHDYGRFSMRDITDIVAILLSYIEGEKYIPFRDWQNFAINESSIIIKEDVSKQHDEIDDDILDMLYKNGDLIMLDRGCANVVYFYEYYGDPNYSFGQFNYLHEFVNRLIQYRIDNNKIKYMTFGELYSFMCDFISTHPDLAQKNKDKREQMLMGKSNEEAREWKKFEKELKK